MVVEFDAVSSKKPFKRTIKLKYRRCPTSPQDQSIGVQTNEETNTCPAAYFSLIYLLRLPIDIARSRQRCEQRGQMRNEPNSKLVVVIDDDPLVLEATAGLLRSWGCQVVTAESYGDALGCLAKIARRPDLIVCDYRLPEGETGIDVIEGLRSVFEIPALLISGDPYSPRGNGLGACRLLHKPVDATTFRNALVNASVLPS